MIRPWRCRWHKIAQHVKYLIIYVTTHEMTLTFKTDLNVKKAETVPSIHQVIIYNQRIVKLSA